jgi:membrane protein DedA with SNARE-associated domain
MFQFVGHLIQQWYSNFGYVGIVLAMTLESCLIPLPSEIVMPLAGALTTATFTMATMGTDKPHFNLVGVALAGAVGCVIGSLAAYGIGAWGGRPVIYRYGKYILVSRTDFDRADRWFLHYGSAITFFSRLLPIVRTYISLPAGIARMRLLPFVAYTFIGSLIWCFVLAFIGQKLGDQYDRLSGIFHGLDAVIVVLVIAAIALYVARHIHHVQRESATDTQSGSLPSARPSPRQ